MPDKLRRLLLACSFFLLPLLALPTLAANSPLPASLKQALAKAKIAEQSLALAIVPLEGGGKARFFNADKRMNPASTMKLVTTYAGLELLGPDYQWRTEFYTDGRLKDGVLSGNLYLKGGGDPKLNLQRLWLLLRDLRTAGVKQVKGDLRLERTYFRHSTLPEFDDDGGDPLRPFLVEPDALLINFKAVRLVVRAEAGKIYLHMDPPLASVPMVNQVKLLPAKKNCPAPLISFHLREQEGTTSLLVKGQLAEGCRTEFYLSLLDHPNYAFDAVRALWQEMGGTIEGKNGSGLLPEPHKRRLLSRSFSPDLTEIIRDINKYSNNTMARQLFLSIGAQLHGNEETHDQAANRAIRTWLTKKNIKTNHLLMENGSGLSRNERISAAELAAILQAAWKSPYAAEFISSLPLVAIDGTMRKRLRGTALAGQAHIKTGALNNSRAIAGFCRDKNGKSWAVVAILNGPKLWNASTVLDQVLLDVYQQRI